MLVSKEGCEERGGAEITPSSTFWDHYIQFTKSKARI